jgi:hypothetical protein
MYNYCKPEIVLNENNSYINTTKMRHQILERLITNVEYIPHSIFARITGNDNMFNW